VISLSQLVPALRVNSLFTNLAPLCLVLTVTIIKEAYDDYKRYLRDKDANGQRYTKLTSAGPVSIPSADIKVGDVIVLEKDQRVPADMILLRTAEHTGSLFIRTDQLDGEIDWKVRNAVSYTQKLPGDAEVFHVNGEIYAEAPHKDIHTFVGTFTHDTVEGSTTEPLSVDNTLWMNTVVASGGSHAGVVMYTGSETRAVMNTSQPKTKSGLVDLELNSLTKILGVIVVALAFALVSLKGLHGAWLVYFFRFVVLFSTIIPLSLRVNLDMGKTFYSSDIMGDSQLDGVIVRTSTIPEELGRIGYLLSDKTGTLTKNDMELKKVHLGTMAYGPESKGEVHQLLGETLGEAQKRATPVAHRGKRDISSRLYEAVQALALCHNVTPVLEAGGQVSYQASSPDEIAIVRWTESVGLALVSRDRDSVRLSFPSRQLLLAFDILHVFPFTSELKRMGIVVRDRASGEILFYQKGADMMMARIVQQNDWLEEESGNMAREGLRTLAIGRKRLSPEAFAAFDSAYREARIALSNRAARMQAVVTSHLERDLELLALTGVEDKLQEGVKMTLEVLRQAEIKIWMLTGDKIETATNIAVSTRLFGRNQRIHTVQHLATERAAKDELAYLRGKPDLALVIDGPSLRLLMAEAEFVPVAMALPAVVCCRCTPTQKADIAGAIKAESARHPGRRRVACIGDGGNDVSMIQTADVGIGIVGKEGRQASLAADFSLGQFKDLRRLILWHGRNSYKRTAKLSLFVIHRGFVIAVLQSVFSAIFYYAPIALYQGWIAVGYTTVYTMWPVFSLVLDKDVTEETAMLYPELYKDLTKGRELAPKEFFKWLTISVYQGGVIMLMAIWLFERDFIHIVSITFTALILNELLMVALEVSTWHYLMGVAEIGSFLMYVISVRLLKGSFDVRFTTSWTFFWKVLLITLATFLPLYLFKLLKHIIAPPSSAKLQE
jgi:phospholipid-translocating ATPase